MITVLATESHPIRAEADISAVRRRVRELAAAKAFDGFAAAAITTATSELSRNVLVHGGGGEAIIEQLEDGLAYGLRVSFRDGGKGIDDLQRVLAGGYSTARSMGLGVSGSRRLVDAFEIDSKPGQGTTVVITKWRRF